eukprot:scaffold164324_cov27-Tisochrysis_lutea.AAC.2
MRLLPPAARLHPHVACQESGEGDCPCPLSRVVGRAPCPCAFPSLRTAAAWRCKRTHSLSCTWPSNRRRGERR